VQKLVLGISDHVEVTKVVAESRMGWNLSVIVGVFMGLKNLMNSHKADRTSHVAQSTRRVILREHATLCARLFLLLPILGMTALRKKRVSQRRNDHRRSESMLHLASN